MVTIGEFSWGYVLSRWEAGNPGWAALPKLVECCVICCPVQYVPRGA